MQRLTTLVWLLVHGNFIADCSFRCVTDTTFTQHVAAVFVYGERERVWLDSVRIQPWGFPNCWFQFWSLCTFYDTEVEIGRKISVLKFKIGGFWEKIRGGFFEFRFLINFRPIWFAAGDFNLFLFVLHCANIMPINPTIPIYINEEQVSRLSTNYCEFEC